jgi:hypothetical protein
MQLEIHFHVIEIYTYILITFSLFSSRGHRGHDWIVVEFITTYGIGTYHHCEFESRSGDVYSIQHYVIKFVSDLRQVVGFLRVLQFLPPIRSMNV